jgi:hypothetical protein
MTTTREIASTPHEAAPDTNGDPSARHRRRHVLVVVDRACTPPAVCAAVRAQGGTDTVDAYVVAPSHDADDPRWYVDEDAAWADAQHRLRQCVTCLGADGARVSGTVGDPDPVRAIADALQVFDADEILLLAAPQRPSSWLRPDLADRVRSAFGRPTCRVAVPHVNLEHDRPSPSS